MAELSGEEKAALLLLSLDPPVAQNVLAQLGPDRKTRLSGHMTRLGALPELKQQMTQVLQEADELLQEPNLRLVAAPDAEARTPKEASKPGSPKQPPASAKPAPAPAPAKPVGSRVDVVTPEPGARLTLVHAAEGPATTVEVPGDSDPLVELNRLDPERLGMAFEGENARTIAVILSHLSVDLAGTVFKQFKAELRRDVSVQMGLCVMPGVEVVKRAGRALLTKARAIPAPSGEAKGNSRYKKMADLLKRLERPERTEALSALQERDPAIASQIADFLYEFEDLMTLDGRSIQKVLSEMDSKTLAIALKGATDEIRDKVMENMSKRAREGLLEELEFLSSVPAGQINQAKKSVVEIIQRMDQAGEIVMLR
jgi:flagellar motor switch protein FliG